MEDWKKEKEALCGGAAGGAALNQYYMVNQTFITAPYLGLIL